MAKFLLKTKSYDKIEMIKLLTVIIFLNSLVLVSFGQKSSLKKGLKKVQKGEYNIAIAQLEKIKDRDLAGISNFYIGESYRLSNRNKYSEPYYRKAISSGYRDGEVYFYHAMALKANGNYREAEGRLEEYLKKTEDERMTEIANQELANLLSLTDLSTKVNYYQVKNLQAINTSAAEYSPVYSEGDLFFTSNRDGGKIYKTTGTGYTNIYKIKTKGAIVDLETLQPMSAVINDPDINDGSITFTNNGRTVVFAKANTGKRSGTRDVNLYISRYRNKKWSPPRMLNINVPGAWDSSPAFSVNGRTLYFASTREGGYGGADLYSAKMDRRGRFGQVKNLGPEINTHGDEVFPYVSDDGKLYFSSNGHPGLGALDLFIARRENGKTFIENMGVGLNSVSDDFGLFLFKADRGFFTSNRDGGKGDDDIYTFKNEDPNLKVVNYFLEGITMTHTNDGSEKILPNVRVKLMQIFDEEPEEIDEVITGTDGKFNFRVSEHENYILIGEKLGSKEKYYVTREDYTTIGKSIPQEELTELVTNITLDTVLFLDKIKIEEVIVLENIYYDLDKAEIRDDAAQELDKLLDLLLDNPEINIELSSHTDSRADDNYNMSLSKQRAKSAVNYLIMRGVDRSRLVARGYGESKPIIPDAFTEEEHQRNRRTEFKVTSINATNFQEGDDVFEEDKYFKNEIDHDGNGKNN